MKSRRLVLIALGALFLLHHDLWWWDADDRLLGLPIGMTWHVLLCLAVSLAMAVFARVDGSGSEADS